jgi:phosphonopyruvate decarboxylase
MIRAETFVRHLQQANFGLFTGVPCSYLTPLINTVIDAPDVQYIGAANEGDAVAIACGAELGGTRGVVMFQNSGLGNAVSPLTSLTTTFRIPVLVITTWRGQPGGPADEPQHELMGQITPQLLELMGIPWKMFPENEDEISDVLDHALDHMQSQQTPYALIMRKGAVAAHALQSRPDSSVAVSFQLAKSQAGSPWPQRSHDQDDVLQTIQRHVSSTDAVLATTGFTGRALYALDDRPNQLYMVGSMGCISSLGLGMAKVQPQRRVVVIDGDGALLMRMSALATIGHEQPANLIHILLDNAAHDSTGTQATVSSTMDFAGVARACGYPRAASITELDELADALRDGERTLQFLHVKTNPRENRKLPRPEITPAEVALRFRQWLEQNPCELQLERAC